MGMVTIRSESSNMRMCSIFVFYSSVFYECPSILVIFFFGKTLSLVEILLWSPPWKEPVLSLSKERARVGYTYWFIIVIPALYRNLFSDAGILNFSSVYFSEWGLHSKWNFDVISSLRKDLNVILYARRKHLARQLYRSKANLDRYDILGMSANFLRVDDLWISDQEEPHR